MIDVIEITIEEFENNIYCKYINLFPEEEQREWIDIKKTYQDGIEKMYKIVLNDTTIGFFMLEKIKDHPFYLDYFAIYKEYQNKGYGTKAIKKLIDKIGDNEGIIGEIEKENNDDINTIKRFEFYKRLGFEKIESEYLFYNVYFTPIVYTKGKKIDKEKFDKIIFEYYKTNCGENVFKRNFKIIK